MTPDRTLIRNIPVGGRFRHNGDWQTEAGVWEVVQHDKETSMITCKPITHPYEGQSEFFPNVSVYPVA